MSEANAEIPGLPSDLIPAKEASDLAKICMSGLWRWVSQGRITVYHGLSAWRPAKEKLKQEREARHRRIKAACRAVIPTP